MKKILPILLLICAASAFGQLATSYDKFKDTTTVSFIKGRAKENGNKRYWLDVSGSFNYQGTAMPGDMNSFLLTFTGMNSDWMFIDSHRLILLVDGKQMPLGNGWRVGSVTGYGVTEVMGYRVNRDEFAQIANAKTVELQLGYFEGAFDDKTIAQCQELLKAATK